MQSPKYIFYLSQNNNTLFFKKDMFINESNQIRWSEIHVTQFVIFPMYKKIYKKIMDEGSSLTINIENFNENVDGVENYTCKMLNIDEPYKYDNRYSSKIIDPAQFTINGNIVELKVNLLMDNGPIDEWFYSEDEKDAADNSVIFEIELYFK